MLQFNIKQVIKIKLSKCNAVSLSTSFKKARTQCQNRLQVVQSVHQYLTASRYSHHPGRRHHQHFSDQLHLPTMCRPCVHFHLCSVGKAREAVNFTGPLCSLSSHTDITIHQAKCE